MCLCALPFSRHWRVPVVALRVWSNVRGWDQRLPLHLSTRTHWASMPRVWVACSTLVAFLQISAWLCNIVSRSPMSCFSVGFTVSLLCGSVIGIGKTCHYAGLQFPHGSRWEEDCNTCQCVNGKVECTKVVMGSTAKIWLRNLHDMLQYLFYIWLVGTDKKKN